MTYRSTKTYGHDVGLSVCFRQWRADSHCNRLHGYALAVGFVFEADTLDHRNWVVDFGGLATLKGWLQQMFDHKTLVAQDDPSLPMFALLSRTQVIDLVVVEATGCEAFARLIFDRALTWLGDQGYAPRVRLVSVEVREHGANSALVVA